MYYIFLAFIVILGLCSYLWGVVESYFGFDVLLVELFGFRIFMVYLWFI